MDTSRDERVDGRTFQALLQRRQAGLPVGAHRHTCPTCPNYFMCIEGTRDARGQVDDCPWDSWTCPTCDQARRDMWMTEQEAERTRAMLTFNETTYAALTAPATADRLNQLARLYDVPEALIAPLVAYVTSGVVPGDPMTRAVIDNDLAGAHQTIVHDTPRWLDVLNLAMCLHHGAPRYCWGRPGAADEWHLAHEATVAGGPQSLERPSGGNHGDQ